MIRRSGRADAGRARACGGSGRVPQASVARPADTREIGSREPRSSARRRWTTSTSSRRRSCFAACCRNMCRDADLPRDAGVGCGGARGPHDGDGFGDQQCIDMIDSLTLTMNRVRQASITKEIIEIVSGAAALS